MPPLGVFIKQGGGHLAAGHICTADEEDFHDIAKRTAFSMLWKCNKPKKRPREFSGGLRLAGWLAYALLIK